MAKGVGSVGGVGGGLDELDEDAAYDLMSDTMATNAVTCDAQEGIGAFLAKREPVWLDR